MYDAGHTVHMGHFVMSCIESNRTDYIQVIYCTIGLHMSHTSGDVDNNLGPDRLAGPKALDPNYCRQPFL